MRIVLALVFCLIFGVSIGLLRPAWHFGLLDASRATVPFGYPQERNETLWEPSPDGPQPQLSLDGERHDFGVMEVDTKGRYSFAFRNTGEYPLVLRRGETTCQCTLARLEDDAIEPGGSADVILEWTAIPPSSGWTNRFHQRARIHTNDPKRPVVELTITGELTMPVRLVPEDFAFQDLAQRQAKTADLQVFGFRDAPLEITDQEVLGGKNSEHFSVEWSALSGDALADESAKSGYQVRVSIKPGLPLGPFRRTIRLHTNYDDVPTVDIPVEGRIVGNCIVRGRHYNRQSGILSIPKVSSGTGVRVELNVLVYGTRNDNRAVESTALRVAKTTPSVLVAKLGPPRPHDHGQAKRYPLIIEIPAKTPPMKYEGPQASQLGEITLETGFEAMPKMKIRVKFVVVP